MGRRWFCSYRLCCSWDDPVPSGCGNAAAALLYFNSFIILVSYAMLNLFVAVVIEQFGVVCGEVRGVFALFKLDAVVQCHAQCDGSSSAGGSTAHS